MAHGAYKKYLYVEAQIGTLSMLSEQIYRDGIPDERVSDALSVVHGHLVERSVRCCRDLLLWMGISPDALPEEDRRQLLGNFVAAGRDVRRMVEETLGVCTADDADELMEEIDDR